MAEHGKIKRAVVGDAEKAGRTRALNLITVPSLSPTAQWVC